MAKLKRKFSSLEETKTYIQNNMTIQQMVDELAEFYTDQDDVLPIRITQAQLSTFFKIVGVTDNCSKETRGRKPKKVEE